MADEYKWFVNVKEHLEALWVEREKRLEDRFKAIMSIFEATAKEMAHRLGVLNHAHKQSLEDRADFMKSSEWKLWKIDFDVWKTEVNRQLTEAKTRSITWTAAICIFFVIVQIVLKFWKG